MSQLTCAHKRMVQCNLPLSLYSVSCFSPRSIDFGGAEALVGFSTTVAFGRAFSSCLRNGLRMIGIVRGVWDCCNKSIRKRCCSCAAEIAKRNTQCDGRQVARRSGCGDRVGQAGDRVAASCDLRERSWGRRRERYWYYVVRVDAVGLSRCTWEWKGVGRRRGLCYETDRWTKRGAVHERDGECRHGMARSRDSTVGRRGMNCVEVQIIKVDTASMTTNLGRDVPLRTFDSQHHLDCLFARAESALRLCMCNINRPDMRPRVLAGGTFVRSVVRVCLVQVLSAVTRYKEPYSEPRPHQRVAITIADLPRLCACAEVEVLG